MLEKRPPTLYRTLLMAFMILGAFWSNTADAQELRCQELGANCLCSEPMQQQNYELKGGTSWGWGPVAYGNSKMCAVDGLAGALYSLSTAGVNKLTSTTDPTILGAFPPGKNVTRVLRGSEGQTGQWFLGHKRASSGGVARFAARFYIYYSSNYEIVQSDPTRACLNNGKLTSASTTNYKEGPILSTQGGTKPWALYSWGTPPYQWTPGPTIDCCVTGPSADPGATPTISIQNSRGKWVRFEQVFENNTGGPGIVIKIYAKNVTDNSPEYKIVDTSIPCNTTNCGPGTGWLSQWTTSLTPPTGNPIGSIYLDLFRNGTCAGFNALSHYLSAEWSTNTGQRIGAASEIESGTGDTTPPAPPTNLRTSMLMLQE